MSPELYVTIAVYSLISLASVGVWVWAIGRWRVGEQPLAFRERPHVEIDLLVVLSVLIIWLIIPSTVNHFIKPTDGPSLHNVQLSCLSAGLTIIGVVVTLLGAGRIRPQEIGLTIDRWRTDLRDGGLGYLAAFLPIVVVLLATAPFRSEETLHPFLQVLRKNPEPATVMWMVLVAVVIAPLLEELLFRVVLQGALTARLGPQLAISVVALGFSAVHGWPDSIPLIPLALVLGYVYHQRHSYLSVVVLHGIFNATNLLFALLTAEQAAGR